MYLRLLARRERRRPGTTIKGNIPHPLQKAPFSQGCPGPSWDGWNSSNA